MFPGSRFVYSISSRVWEWSDIFSAMTILDLLVKKGRVEEEFSTSEGNKIILIGVKTIL